MKYYDVFSENGYHSAFLTTFTFGCQSFEDIVLQRLRNAGCNNINVLADQTMINQEFSLFDPPRFAGSHYHIVKCHRQGAFHPKIVLQLGNKKARLLIGSANLTGSGLSGNLELVSQITCSGAEDPSVQLIAEVLNYIVQSVEEDDPWFKRGYELALKRSPWFDATRHAPGFEHPDLGLTALIHDAYELTPLEQFISLIDGDQIECLNIVSPYWDAELRALKNLAEQLKHPQIRIALDTKRGLFPKNVAEGIPDLTVHELASISGSRSVHAKLFIAEGADFDHVLSGSFNCSRPALLTSLKNPVNAEAGIYRRIAKKTAVSAMGLQSCFEVEINLNELPEFEQASLIAENKFPVKEGGRLFLSANKLSWYPPHEMLTKEIYVELRGNGVCRAIKLIPPSNSQLNDPWIGTVELEYQTVTYGIIIFGDSERSAPVPICNINKLIRKSLPVASREVQKQYEILQSMGSEDLQIIDILYKLEQLEVSEIQSKQLLHRSSQRDISDQSATEFQTLTYEDFTKSNTENRLNPVSVSDDVFIDRYVSAVPNVLNRILGLVAPEVSEPISDENVDLRPTEHSNEEDIGSGNFANQTSRTATSRESEKSKTNTHTKEAIVNAVYRFTEVLSKNETKEISLTQLIYLRALLQIILAFSIPINDKTCSGKVLPPFDPEKIACWPRLVGKTLAAFYRYGPNPIANFKLPEGIDAIPCEIIDCWACIEVAANLSAKCAKSFAEAQFIAGHLEKLSEQTSTWLNQNIKNYPEAKLRFNTIKNQLGHRFSSLS